MKTSALFLALVAIVASANAACSDAGRGDDVDSALDAFRHPTGTFSKETGPSAFSNYRSKQSESSKVSTPESGASSGTSNTQSVRLLAKTVNSQAQCSEGQACPCEGGGSKSYTQEQRSDGLLLKLTFNDCLEADKTGFTGKAVLLTTDKPILGDDSDLSSSSSSASPSPSSSSSSAASDAPNKTGSGVFGTSKPSALPAATTKNLLLVAKGSAIEGSKQVPIEVALVKESGVVLLAVEVPDGKIVIGIASDRSAFVKAKQGTFLCRPKGKEGYACTPKNGGEELDVSADTSSSDSKKAPASAGGEGPLNDEYSDDYADEYSDDYADDYADDEMTDY